MRYFVGFRRLREGENEVIYTETDCISGLPMFRGDLVVKTTYRVTRDEDDPDNSVRVKVKLFRDIVGLFDLFYPR